MVEVIQGIYGRSCEHAVVTIKEENREILVRRRENINISFFLKTSSTCSVLLGCLRFDWFYFL